jgi:hypothetical protein
MRNWTRRDWFHAMAAGLGGLFVARAGAATPDHGSLFVEKLLARFPAPEFDREICYRADATIQILKVPVFKRRGVGGAVASVREYRSGAEQALGISFLAGSNPSEAGGVNRFGYIEELVIERQSVPLEAAYFGVMTSSPEESFESARKAMGEAGKKQTYYAGIDGYLKASRSVSTEAAFLSSGAYTWGSHPPLSDLLRSALRDGGSKLKEKSDADPKWDIPVTFLYAVARSLKQPGGKHTLRYVYHGHEFELETEQEADASAGREFAERKLVERAEDVVRVNGRSKQLDASRKTAFTLWKDVRDQSGLPLRFEFRPKSFLKLSFEADPAIKPPASASWRRTAVPPTRGE